MEKKGRNDNSISYIKRERGGKESEREKKTIMRNVIKTKYNKKRKKRRKNCISGRMKKRKSKIQQVEE